MEKEISVIIPACNEAQSIERNVLMLEEFLGRNYRSHEIIVAEDGSTDGTDRILGELSSRNANIMHLHSDRKLGKGRAISMAFLSSCGRKVLLIDADFPVGLECIPRMTGLLESNDLVLGSRFTKGSSAERSLKRAFLSVSYNSFVRLLFRTGIRDHQCGVKAMRSSLKGVVLEVRENGFFWDTELIVRARQRNRKLFETPITWRERDK